MLLVKEIHVNGVIDPSLSGLIAGDELSWRTLDDSVIIDLFFEGLCIIESVEIGFWAMCFAESIRLFYWSTESSHGPCWTLLSTEADAISSGNIDRTVSFTCMRAGTDRLRIEMSRGHVDEFFHRYRIGVRSLKCEGVKVKSITPSSSQAASRVRANTSPAYMRVSRSSSRMIRDSVFQFPDGFAVLDAISQTASSPWRILSAKSKHSERLRETVGDKYIRNQDRYLLRPLGSASQLSLPSRSDILRLSTTL